MEEGQCEDRRYDDPCEGEVTYEPCPYQSELYEDYTPVWLCEHHRYERAMDV